MKNVKKKKSMRSYNEKDYQIPSYNKKNDYH